MFVYFQEENDSLRCQLEAYKNEVDLVRSDLKTELDQKEKQMKMLQQTLQGMQQVGLGSASCFNLFRYCEEWNRTFLIFINLNCEINVSPKYL
jgi:Tfp pilus assembly protein PilO